MYLYFDITRMNMHRYLYVMYPRACIRITATSYFFRHVEVVVTHIIMYKQTCKDVCIYTHIYHCCFHTSFLVFGIYMLLSHV